jgi:hypothetical protein
MGLYKNNNFVVRFQGLTAPIMKMTVFWDVAPCSLVKVYRRFRGSCCVHHHRPDDGGSKNLQVAKVLFRMTVFWDFALCSLVEVCRRFGGAYCLHHYRPDDGGSQNI